ncbi:MAG: phage tail tape measure protein [Sphingobacteriales bacterium]|nr:phage tail tape measure protein [Sphingobacteriales bacterium]
MKNLTSWSFKVADNQITAALKTIQQKLAGMEAGVGKAEAKFNAFAVGAANKLHGIRAGFKKNFNNLADEIPQLDGLRRVVTNPLAQAVAGAAAMGVYLKDATALSAEFDKSMAKVNVTLQKSPAELRNIGNQVAEIARKNGLANLSDAPLALNKIVSAGIDDTKQALALLDPTLKAAKAGFTDVETVAGAAVSVIKSSGIDNATRVYDVLFATLNKGNAEFRDIANYLPQIIPSARAAGVSLEEVGGSFAYPNGTGLAVGASKYRVKEFCRGNWQYRPR